VKKSAQRAYPLILRTDNVDHMQTAFTNEESFKSQLLSQK
jgi:hypothetical protein